MIRSLKISGFRSLRDIQLGLLPLNVLIGPNQSGKTNLLDSLDLLKQAGEGRLGSAIYQRRGGLVNILWAGKTTEEIRFDLSFLPEDNSAPFNSAGLGFSVVPTSTCYIGKQAIFEGHDKTTNNKVHYYEEQGRQELAILRNGEIPVRQLVDTILSELKSLLIYPGFDSKPRWAATSPNDTPQMRQSQFVSYATVLDPSGDNLVNVLYTLSQDEDRWDDFKSSIRTGFPDFDNIAFPADADQGRIALAWVDRRSPRKKFPAEVLSAGTLCFLAYAAALAAPETPSLIAIDEPEQHLHPELLYRLVGLMEQASAKHQIIVTTHSDALLSYLSDPTSIVLVNNGPEGTTFTRPPEADLAAWLKKYNLGQLRESGHLAAFAVPDA